MSWASKVQASIPATKAKVSAAKAESNAASDEKATTKAAKAATRLPSLAAALLAGADGDGDESQTLSPQAIEFIGPEDAALLHNAHYVSSGVMPTDPAMFGVAQGEYEMGVVSGMAVQPSTVMMPSGEVVLMNLAMGADGLMYPVVAAPQYFYPPGTYGVEGYGRPDEWPKGLVSYLSHIQSEDYEADPGIEDINSVYLQRVSGDGSGESIIMVEGKDKKSNQSTKKSACKKGKRKKKGGRKQAVEVYI